MPEGLPPRKNLSPKSAQAAVGEASGTGIGRTISGASVGSDGSIVSNPKPEARPKLIQATGSEPVFKFPGTAEQQSISIRRKPNGGLKILASPTVSDEEDAATAAKNAAKNARQKKESPAMIFKFDTKELFQQHRRTYKKRGQSLKPKPTKDGANEKSESQNGGDNADTDKDVENDATEAGKRNSSRSVSGSSAAPGNSAVGSSSSASSNAAAGNQNRNDSKKDNNPGVQDDNASPDFPSKSGSSPCISTPMVISFTTPAASGKKRDSLVGMQFVEAPESLGGADKVFSTEKAQRYVSKVPAKASYKRRRDSVSEKVTEDDPKDDESPKVHATAKSDAAAVKTQTSTKAKASSNVFGISKATISNGPSKAIGSSGPSKANSSRGSLKKRRVSIGTCGPSDDDDDSDEEPEPIHFQPAAVFESYQKPRSALKPGRKPRRSSTDSLVRRDSAEIVDTPKPPGASLATPEVLLAVPADSKKEEQLEKDEAVGIINSQKTGAKDDEKDETTDQRDDQKTEKKTRQRKMAEDEDTDLKKKSKKSDEVKLPASLALPSLSTNEILAGVDEAGRGCWVGPVVCAAVALDGKDKETLEKVSKISGITDSKMLNEKQREIVYEQIISTFKHYKIVEVSAARIDEINILEASFEGMVKAVGGLQVTPTEVKVDGPYVPTAWRDGSEINLRKNAKKKKGASQKDACQKDAEADHEGEDGPPRPAMKKRRKSVTAELKLQEQAAEENVSEKKSVDDVGKKAQDAEVKEASTPPPFKVQPVIKGDSKELTIAAASILAKVTRDRICEGKLSSKFPGYGFDKNKGYGTAEHREAIRTLGICDEHRKSYAPIKAALGISDEKDGYEGDVEKTGNRKRSRSMKSLIKLANPPKAATVPTSKDALEEAKKNARIDLSKWLVDDSNKVSKSSKSKSKNAKDASAKEGVKSASLKESTKDANDTTKQSTIARKDASKESAKDKKDASEELGSEAKETKRKSESRACKDGKEAKEYVPPVDKKEEKLEVNADASTAGDAASCQNKKPSSTKRARKPLP